MSAHRMTSDLHQAYYKLADPGNAGTISVDRNGCVVDLVSAGAETRTLGRPTHVGDDVCLHFSNDGGDIVVTVTGGFNEDGDTTFTFSDEGQYVCFRAFVTKAGVYFWRKISDYGLGNIAPGDAAVLDELSGLTATPDELNLTSDLSARDVAITGSTTITQALHGDRNIVLNANSDMTITLPAMSGSGARYKFCVATAFSSKSAKIVATGKHLFGSLVINTDTSVGFAEAFQNLAVVNDGGATNITLNGATTGGRKGDWVLIEDIASSVGLVSGQLNGSGTETTPFS